MTEPVRLSYSTPEDPLGKKMLIEAIEWLTGKPKLERKYRHIKGQNLPSHEMWKAMVEELKLTIALDHGQLDKIPTDGPVVFIANHPFGVLDGIVMGYLASMKRPAFKFLVNAVLCRDDQLNRYFLPVDFAETKAAQQTNINTRNEALQRLSDGEALVLFPAGGVATSPKLWGKAVDLEWKNFVLKLIRRSGAAVVPVFFYGQNSRLFQIASHLSMALRLSLLLHEVRNKMGSTLRLEVGDPIPFEQLPDIKDSKKLLRYLYESVHGLAK